MKRITKLSQLPKPVQELEEYCQELWMGVYNDAIDNDLENPDTRAYRAVEWYMSNREMDSARGLMIRVITPGEIQASTGEFNWTKADQSRLLKTAVDARSNGIIPAIWYGDHDNKTSIGWAVEVWEQDFEGSNWIYVRPFITDDHIRTQMFDGTLRYASAEITPELEMHGKVFKNILTGVVILDPAYIPGTYPAVPNSGVLVASVKKTEHDTICLVTAGVELTERRPKVAGENKNEMTADEVLLAVNKVAESVTTMSGAVEGMQSALTENTSKLSGLDDRIKALETAKPEPKPEEIAQEVKASLDTMSEDQEKFVACLSAGGRTNIEKVLCEVKDSDSRKAFLSILGSFPKLDMTEQTNANERGQETKSSDALRFSAEIKDDDERAKLRAESVLKFRDKVDMKALTSGETRQEGAVKLSQAEYPNLWKE